jgi:hypothetical protein
MGRTAQGCSRGHSLAAHRTGVEMRVLSEYFPVLSGLYR